MKTTKTSTTIAGLRADIWTRDVGNTNPECWSLDPGDQFHIVASYIFLQCMTRESNYLLGRQD
jgi:hypothetical protein